MLRRNKLLSNAHIQLQGENDAAAPGVSDVIVENNVVENSDFGIEMDKGLLNVYLKGNQLPVGKMNIFGMKRKISHRHKAALQHNTIK